MNNRIVKRPQHLLQEKHLLQDTLVVNRGLGRVSVRGDNQCLSPSVLLPVENPCRTSVSLYFAWLLQPSSQGVLKYACIFVATLNIQGGGKGVFSVRYGCHLPRVAASGPVRDPTPSSPVRTLPEQTFLGGATRGSGSGGRHEARGEKALSLPRRTVSMTRCRPKKVS